MSSPVRINESFLFSGKDLYLSNNVIVKHPSVGNILDITNDINSVNIYWKIVGTLICDPYDNMVMLDDLGINYLEVTPFDVFIIQWNKAIEEYSNKEIFYIENNFHPLDAIKESLSFFLGKHNFDLSFMNIDNQKEIVLVDLDTIHQNTCDYYITKEMYNLMSEFLFSINKLSKSDRINPADETTRKMLIEDTRDELKRQQRQHNSQEQELEDCIGIASKSVCFGGNGGINVFNYKQLKIYQLLVGATIIDKKEYSSHLLSAIYSGNIKSGDVNKDDLNWKK